MKKDYQLISDDYLTQTVRQQNIKSWDELISFIQNLPYGRTSNREDFSLIISERKGTCSSKHAFLKTIANLNDIPNVQLIIGMYKMNQLNTPGIGSALSNSSLDYIPEAHCYLKINGKRSDLTSMNSNFDRIEKDLIEEIEIQPEQVTNFKVSYHKDFIKDWLSLNQLGLQFQEVWEIRERCIENLSS